MEPSGFMMTLRPEVASEMFAWQDLLISAGSNGQGEKMDPFLLPGDIPDAVQLVPSSSLTSSTSQNLTPEFSSEPLEKGGLCRMLAVSIQSGPSFP
jgi:hypothetical protein